MKTDRPVNLNLLVFSFPLAAIVSITHRITGVMLFVGVAFALYALGLAMSSEQGFAEAKVLVAQPLGMFILLGLIATLTFHIIAGLKHLLMDFHVGDTVGAAYFGSIAVIVLTLIVTGAIGVVLW
ncbi:succinate dehydrogenase, cytochrome b556 subunit [Pseudomonadales bacterium]|nr:succinate dehydrogenase, cytochrome b556 subunit [Pseudomonadales bacterium]